MNEKKLKLREETLKILLKNFGDKHSNKLIYECADEWCSKFDITSGLVKYFKVYYSGQAI